MPSRSSNTGATSVCEASAPLEPAEAVLIAKPRADRDDDRFVVQPFIMKRRNEFAEPRVSLLQRREELPVRGEIRIFAYPLYYVHEKLSVAKIRDRLVVQ